MHADTGQEAVWWLDNSVEPPPLGDAVPRHRLDSLNTSTGGKKKMYALDGAVIPKKRPSPFACGGVEPVFHHLGSETLAGPSNLGVP